MHMSNANVPIEIPARSRFHNIKLLLPAIVLFIGLMAFNVWRLDQAGKPELQANGFPISSVIEERFGVRFTGLHLVGRNGLVDLRYRVLDAGKAKNFGHYTETSPLIIDEESGGLVEVTIMGLHNHRVETGRGYYILYRNTANVLQPGRRVTIQLGDERLEHVMVQ
jgi:hypothetical protein